MVGNRIENFALYDVNGQPWAAGTESLVSVELGVEPVEGVGDMKVSNYRVWKP